MTVATPSPASNSNHHHPVEYTTTTPELDHKLPSTLTGEAVSVLLEPGKCQFGPDKVAVPLLERRKVSPNASVVRFGLPDPSQPLQLSTCACLLAHAEIGGELVTRPYTPISTNAHVGTFDLLIKDYGPDAKLSHTMCSLLTPGDTMLFSHIDKNVKIQAPFHEYDEIVMIVGGTGITPMIQALHAILGDESSRTKVTMLFGNRSEEDILGRHLLHHWVDRYKGRFQCIDILSHEPEGSSWQGRRGYVDKELVAALAPPADSNTKFKIFVCGPPPMYTALCGPRKSTEVTGLLGELGYKPEHVYKF